MLLPEKYNAIDIWRLIKAGNGTAGLKTLAGKNIRIMMKGKKNSHSGRK